MPQNVHLGKIQNVQSWYATDGVISGVKFIKGKFTAKFQSTAKMSISFLTVEDRRKTLTRPSTEH
jgi:hypothetical protein